MLLYNYLEKSVEGGHEGEEKKPWRAQNSDGNTALHVALLYGNIGVAKSLLKRDGGLARIVNNSKEAPLHLITRLHPLVCNHMTSVLLERARSVASWGDAKGLTPLHRAASLDPFVILPVTEKIIGVCPESTLVCDASGKSFLHLLIDNKLFDVHQKKFDKLFDLKIIEDLICLKEIRILKDHQDKDGNTPLHIAAKCENIRMVRSLQFKCSANSSITNSDGISAWSMIQQLNLSHQPPEPRSMTKEELNSARKGDMNVLLESKQTIGIEFLASQSSTGTNFLHHLMNKEAIHHYFSSVDDRGKFLNFIQEALIFFPQLVCQTNKSKNTPVHILARLRKTMTDTTLWDSSLLSNLLSICATAITRIKLRRTTTNEADNHDLPWVMQNAEDNTPLHEAIIANNKVLVLELLSYCEESAHLVNKQGETPLHLLAGTRIGMEEFTGEEIMKLVKANFEALGLPNKDGLTPLSRALKAKNLNVVVTLLCNVQDFCDTNGQTLWHLFLESQLLNNFLDDFLRNEAFKKTLKQKDKDGKTLLHLAMKEKCFGFVEKTLETWGGKEEISDGEQLERNEWLMDLLRMPDNDGLTPIIRALEVDNLDLATTLCHVAPEAAKMGDTNGKTIWHLLPKHTSYNSTHVKDLLQNEKLRKVLEQKDKDGNTPLHLAIKGNCEGFVKDLLESYGPSESVSSEGKQSESNQWLKDLLIITDNDGLTPLIRALKAYRNLDLATKLCFLSPEATKLGDTDGKTFWHLLLKHPSFKYEKVNDLLKIEALRTTLKQKDKDGNTPLHIAIKKKCFNFVQDLLETCRSERMSSDENQWLMDLLRTPNKNGETPEDLLADLPDLSPQVEELLLADRRMRGIRSSWRIPRTQLQNYMNSMNVIAALQTTITFTAAFTVPGGLIQDLGTPILIRRVAFQVFMISDVIAMCLSMMVLICLLWMVATTSKRESVLIQDFALSLLLASFVATLLTFMSGVYATISPVRPWIAITTLVLCSLLMLLLHRFMLTKLLRLLKYREVPFVKNKCSRGRPAGSSNTQDSKVCFGRLNCCACASSNSAS